MKTRSTTFLCYLLSVLIIFQTSLPAFAYCDPIYHDDFQVGDARDNRFNGSSVWDSYFQKFRMQVRFYIPIDHTASKSNIYVWGDYDDISGQELGGIKLDFIDNPDGTGNLIVNIKVFECYVGFCSKEQWDEQSFTIPKVTKGEWHFLSLAVDGTQKDWGKAKSDSWSKWTLCHAALGCNYTTFMATFDTRTVSDINPVKDNDSSNATITSQFSYSVDNKNYTYPATVIWGKKTNDYSAWNPYYDYNALIGVLTFGWVREWYDLKYYKVQPQNDTNALFYDNVLWCTDQYNDLRLHDKDSPLQPCANPNPGLGVPGTGIGTCALTISSVPTSCNTATVTVGVSENGKPATDFHNPYGYSYWAYLVYDLIWDTYHVILDCVVNIFGFNNNYAKTIWDKSSNKQSYHSIDVGSNSSTLKWTAPTNGLIYKTNLTAQKVPSTSDTFYYNSFYQNNGWGKNATFTFNITNSNTNETRVSLTARHVAPDGYNMPSLGYQASTTLNFSNSWAMNMAFSGGRSSCPSNGTSPYCPANTSYTDNAAGVLVSGELGLLTLSAAAGFSDGTTTTSCSANGSPPDTSYTKNATLYFKLQSNTPYISPVLTNQTTNTSITLSTTPQALKLNFNAGTLTDTLQLQYRDVGNITLIVSDENQKQIGQFPITVVPHHFNISDITRNTASTSIITSSGALTTNNTTTIKAGDGFTVKLSAMNALNEVTRNFGGVTTGTFNSSDIPSLNSSYAASGSTDVPALKNSNSTNAAVIPGNGYAEFKSVSWDQVGYVKIAYTRPNQYLGAAYPNHLASLQTSSANAGRFIPDHFNVQVTQSPLYNHACGGFTYLGQPFQVSTPYQLTVTPVSSSNVNVTGYVGDWQKLSVTSMLNQNTNYALQLPSVYLGSISSGYYWNKALIGSDSLYPTSTYAPSVVANSYQVNITQNTGTFLVYPKKDKTSAGPNSVNPVSTSSTSLVHTLAIVDADNVTSQPNPFTFNGGFTNGSFYDGRVELGVVTTNGKDLIMPLYIKRYNSDWSPINSDDSCTQPTDLNINTETTVSLQLINTIFNILNASANPSPNIPFRWTGTLNTADTLKLNGTAVRGSNGFFKIPMQINTQAGEKGSFAIFYDSRHNSAPWLQYDSWDTTGIINFCGTSCTGTIPTHTPKEIGYPINSGQQDLIQKTF